MRRTETFEESVKMNTLQDNSRKAYPFSREVEMDFQNVDDKREMQKKFDEASPKLNWDSTLIYLCATVSLTWGTGDIFFFPANVYEYRGGAYLIAYGICLVFFGAPVLYLEMFLGQYHRSSMLTTIRRIVPAFQGVGWMTLTLATVQLFYYQYMVAHIVKFVLFLILESDSTNAIQTCGHAWNDDNCFELFTKSCDQYVGKFRGICTNVTKYNQEITIAELQFYKRVVETKSQSFFETSNFDFSLCACVALSWMLIALGMNRGIRGVGNFLVFPLIVLFAVLPPILYQTTSQNGSADGISALLNVEYKHFINAKMWVTAIKQVIFSLGLGCGGHYVLSSLAPPNTNTFQFMVATVTLDTAYGVYSTILLYSSIGHLCYVTQCDNIHELDLLPAGKTELFSIYSVLLRSGSINKIPIIMFYMAVISNSISTVVANFLTIIVTVSEVINESMKKYSFDLIGVGLAIFYSLITSILATGIGKYFIVIASEVEYIIASLNIILELIVILEFYGVDILCDDICVVLGRPLFSFWSLFGYLSPFWGLMWKLAPAISAVSMINYIMFNYSFLNSDESFSDLKMFLALCFLVQIPAGWFYSHLSMKVHFELFEPGMVYSPKILWLRQRQLRSWPRYFSQLQIENEKYAKELDSILPNHEEFDIEGEWELIYRQFYRRKDDYSIKMKIKKKPLKVKHRKSKAKTSLNMLELKKNKESENKTTESLEGSNEPLKKEKGESLKVEKTQVSGIENPPVLFPTNVAFESDFTQEMTNPEV